MKDSAIIILFLIVFMLIYKVENLENKVELNQKETFKAVEFVLQKIEFILQKNAENNIYRLKELLEG